MHPRENDCDVTKGNASHRNAEALRRERIAQALFPEVAQTYTVMINDEPIEPHSPLEAELVAKSIPKRRREFFAGRHCARQALAKIGVDTDFIGRRADRAPIWPPNTIGSIAHNEDFCCAVASKITNIVSLGIDVESAATLPVNVQPLICAPDEIMSFRRLPCPEKADWVTIAFSAKEAFYKCYYMLVGSPLDFYEVFLSFKIQTEVSGEFRVRLLKSAESHQNVATRVFGRWAVDSETVYCGAHILP